MSVYRSFNPSIVWGMLWCQPVKLIGLVLISLRLALLVQRPMPRFFIVLKAMVLSVGLNIVLPLRLSEVIKPAYLWNHARIPLSVGTSAAFFERLTDLVIFCLFAIACLILYLGGASILGLLVILSILCAVLFLFPYLEPLLRNLFSHVPSEKVRAFAANFLTHSVRHISTEIKYISLGLGAIIWMVSYLTVAIFLLASGYNSVGFEGAFLVFVATTVGLAIPLFPGGIGTYEAGAVVALKSLGFSLEEAVVVAVSMHVSQFILFFTVAIALLLKERIGLSGLVKKLIAGYGL